MIASHRARLVAFIFSLMVPVLAGAAAVDQIYNASVPVENQSPDARNDALREALRETLVRISGRQEVLETSAVRDLLGSPSRFVQQYRYAIEPVPGSETGEEQLMLYAMFDGSALEKRMRSYGLPVWGRERPRTLVLMAIDLPQGGRMVMGRDNAVAAIWEKDAIRRGLPVIVPEMDSEDRGRIAATDIWGVFEEPLRAAAERYDPNAVLAASAWPIGSHRWAIRSTLLRDGELSQRWEHQADSLADLIAITIDKLAETYAAEFTIGTSGFILGNDSVVMEIRDVTSLQAYARTLDYIASLSVVESVSVNQVEQDRLILDVALRGSRDALEKAIALGRMLEPLRSNEITIPLGDVGGMEIDQQQSLVFRYRN